MSVTIYSGQVVGLDARPISVEVDVAPGLHVFSIVGLADKEVQESRQRIAAAIKNLGALAPHKKSQRVIVNLAPADIKKEGPAFDLPIALGYLLASGQIIFDPKKTVFLGELGLDGTLRPVSGVLPIALAARMSGFTTLVVPKGNGTEASLIGDFTIVEAESLFEVMEYLAGRKTLVPIAHTPIETHSAFAHHGTDFQDIRGQETAKRALAIAAAGGHNVLMSGPPGAGKTLLARALPSILPPLSFEESLEVSKIYSIAGLLTAEQPFLYHRPFRSPHHTASHPSIIGGGSHPRPGEITLAHRGVLFLDEFPEFERRVIESLRQPLEEHTVTVARSHGVYTFPAQFMLVAAMNPCPCGNFGNNKKDCVCTPGAVTKYKKKLSGPLLDRIDIHITVPEVEYERLTEYSGESSGTIQEKVRGARTQQQKRFHGLPIHTNAEMGIRELKQYVVLDDTLRMIMQDAYKKYALSARAYHRILKLARTIADFEGHERITPDHLGEALCYRPALESIN